MAYCTSFMASLLPCSLDFQTHYLGVIYLSLRTKGRNRYFHKKKPYFSSLKRTNIVMQWLTFLPFVETMKNYLRKALMIDKHKDKI